MGEVLRIELTSAGWPVVKETTLPVGCFVDGITSERRLRCSPPSDRKPTERFGRARILTVRLGGRVDAARARITNYRTAQERGHYDDQERREEVGP